MNDWSTSPHLKWDSRHHEAVDSLVKLGVFSTKERAVRYLRGNALNPIPMLNHYKEEHDCYFLNH